MITHNITVETLLERSIFLVEANTNESHFLWQQNAKNSPYVKAYNYGTPVEWEQGVGWMVTVGKINKRPVCISITFHKLNGCWVGFWYGCSALVDYTMINKWMDKNFKKTYDSGRHAVCDAMNFGHCISAINEHNKQKNS